jgi:hypothetical protein
VKRSITIESNALDHTATIALSGTGVRQLSVNPEITSFGSVAVGSKSEHAITLTNYGKTSVTISRVITGGVGFNESGLRTPLTLSAGRSINFTAHFAPTAIGQVKGSVTIESNALDHTVTIALSGTGTGALGHLAATPSSARFGRVVIGDADSQTIRLNNTGSGSVTISHASVAGRGFRIAGITVPLTIASGRSAMFNIVFTPTSTESVTGSVSLVSNGTDSPLTIAVNGTGGTTTHLLGANPTILSFGKVEVDRNDSLNLMLTNNGNSNVTISSALVSGAGFSKSDNVAGVTLMPAQSAALKVVFAPTAAGNFTGSVTIASNATNSPAKVLLSGTGGLQAIHSVLLEWDPSTSSGAIGYRVYRGTVSGGPYTRLTAPVIPDMQYEDTSVEAGRTYYYVVTSVDSRGVESGYSGQVAARIP